MTLDWQANRADWLNDDPTKTTCEASNAANCLALKKAGKVRRCTIYHVGGVQLLSSTRIRRVLGLGLKNTGRIARLYAAYTVAPPTCVHLLYACTTPLIPPFVHRTVCACFSVSRFHSCGCRCVSSGCRMPASSTTHHYDSPL